MDLNKNSKTRNNWAALDREDAQDDREFVPLDMPMNWHNFLIYFLLWANAVTMIGTGLMLLTGVHYVGLADLVYDHFEDLRSVDIFVAVLCFYLAAYAVITRFSLANCKSGAPSLLMGYYAANAVVALLYLLLASAMTGMPLGQFSSFVIYFIIGDSVVFIFINSAYYSRRTHLFTH